MSAGRSATIAPLYNSTRYALAESGLPYQPRDLRPREREANDTYVFYSPRNKRVLAITGALNFCFALGLEFNASLEVYVERPRRLHLMPHREIDISFWTRTRHGQETFYLTIPSSQTAPGFAGTVQPRERDLLEAAAQLHGLQLSYVYERDLVRDGLRLATYLRLLPYVQGARRVFGRTAIQDRIDAHFDRVPTASFAQLQEALRDIDPANVRAVAASMVHSGHLGIDELRPISMDAPLERRRARHA